MKKKEKYENLDEIINKNIDRIRETKKNRADEDNDNNMIT